MSSRPGALRPLQPLLDDLACVIRSDGRLANVSAGWHDQLGWTRRVLCNRAYLEFVHPEDRSAMATSVAAVAADRPAPATFRSRFRCRDGSYRHLTWRATAMPRTRQVAAVARDVTERELVEAELQRRNAFLQLLQAVSVAANGGPTSSTQALQAALAEVCSQTGWTMGHVLLPSDGDRAGILVSSGIWHVDKPADVAVLRRRHEAVSFGPSIGVPGRVFASGKPEHIADVHRLSPHDADRVRCSLIDAEHMRAVAGFPILVGREVTGVLEFFAESPFEADQLLLDVMAQVGMVLGRIVERTRYESELRLAREVAEAASAAKSEFMSRMSHELRTPLTAVIGYADLLELSDLPNHEKEYVAAIETAGEHLLALINDVLDVSRLEKGELRLSIEPVEVAEVIRDVTDLMLPSADGHHVSLRTQLANDGPRFALSDSQALRQVLLNLVGNAIKYNRPGGDVLISLIGAAGGLVQIDVIDTGGGIAAADLDSIFVPFERLGAARSVEGTGLGLGIARELVAAMDGRLVARSTVGSGTTFSVILTAARSPLEPETAVAPCDSARAAPAGSRRVLYVEDNITNIALMRSFFSRLRPDVQLISTMSGGSAVDLARQNEPHLILLDVNLPDIDGGEVLRQLRADAQTRAIPVVIVSADAFPDRIEDFLAAGALGYVTKPIDVGRLLEFVDQVTSAEGHGPALDVVGRPGQPATTHAVDSIALSRAAKRWR